MPRDAGCVRSGRDQISQGSQSSSPFTCPTGVLYEFEPFDHDRRSCFGHFNRDIAAIAVKMMTEPGDEDRAYPLTGSETLDYYEISEIFTNVLGRQIVYTHPSILKFARKMYVRGLQPESIVVMLGIYTTARLGLAAKVTEDVRHLLQRSPISMEEFVRDYRASWM